MSQLWHICSEIISIKQSKRSPFIIQMSSIKAMTLSMQSLNKLYFQFFQRLVLPHLSKQVNEITQLMRQKTAYEVHRFLEQTLNNPSDNYSTHNNSSMNSSTGDINNLNTAIPPNNYSYQYALPSQVDLSKNLYTDHIHAFNKTSDKHIQESVSFKSKLNIRRVHTGLPYQDQPRPYDPFEFKHTLDDNLMTVTSLSSSNPTNQGLISIPILSAGLSSDFKIDFTNNKESQNKKSRIMRQQVRKIKQVFNQGHSKIQKYNKNGNEVQNKLFNLNVSTKLQKREDSIWMKDYTTYQQRPQIQPRKL